jgi:hypothetical protein
MTSSSVKSTLETKLIDMNVDSSRVSGKRAGDAQTEAVRVRTGGLRRNDDDVPFGGWGKVGSPAVCH